MYIYALNALLLASLILIFILYKMFKDLEKRVDRSLYVIYQNEKTVSKLDESLASAIIDIIELKNKVELLRVSKNDKEVNKALSLGSVAGLTLKIMKENNFTLETELNIAQVLEVLKISRSGLRKYRESGAFPKPIKTKKENGGARPYFSAKDVAEFQAKRLIKKEKQAKTSKKA